MIRLPKKKLTLEPLEIECKTTDCTEGFHYFKPNKGQLPAGCRSCGIEPVTWERIHARDLRDARYTLRTLCLEMIRYAHWTIPITLRAENYAKRKGIIGLEERVPAQLFSSIGRAEIYRDGTQTPKVSSKNPIHLAQHATASCCRKCVWYWHAIPTGRKLLTSEIEHLAALVMMYLKQRLPNLRQDGIHVPPIRNKH